MKAFNQTRARRRLLRHRRGASPLTGALVLVVVAIVLGAGGYYGLKSVPGPKSTSTCEPAALCAPSFSTNDVRLFIPYSPGFGQQLLSVAIGQSLPATVTLLGGETASSFAVNWGDGTVQSNAVGSFAHAYGTLGLFLVTANATVGGTVHTGSGYAFPVATTQSLTNLSLGYYPTLNTTFTNGSSGGVYPWINAGGYVNVSGSYAVPPSDPAFSTVAPTLTSSGGAQSNYVHSSTAASATYTFTNPGTYTITFVAPSTNGTATLYQNYTWMVHVLPVGGAPLSCSLCQAPSAVSPHKGTLHLVEAGGPPINGLDPSYDYDTVGAEPILNIFETLVTYNGTRTGADPGSYVPELATCVPGSVQCTTLYGSDLVRANSTAPGSPPQFWTFVIDKSANFYDPTTGQAQAVYPTDVMFSVARALAYSTLPGPSYYNGWILAQALLPAGNPAWDNGTHYPYNNTPGRVLGSMLINDSGYCPASAITNEHGCITFNVWGGGVAWPDFLQLIADPLGGSVEECSYYLHLGVGLPGFSAGGANVPCPLPGGVAGGTTNSSAWASYLASVSPTSWDSYEISGGTNYPAATPITKTLAAGSGPYYLVSANFQIGYVLKANPFYQQPAGCAGQAACLPAPGHYAGTVDTQWLLSDQQGIADYEAGYADLAGIYTSDTTTLLTLLQKGLIGVKTVPTLNIFFLLMNLEINVHALQLLDIYPTNIQANTFSYIGLRDLMATSIPYNTVSKTLFTVDGIQYFFNYGGFIPQYMADYYPYNASFPNYNNTSGQFTDPVTNTSNPNAANIQYSMAWYWKEMRTPGSPFYDPQFGPGPGQYNPSNPLRFPLIGEIGATSLDATYRLMISIIEQVTGGAITPDTFDISFSQLGANIGPAGTTGLGFWNLGWAPDYANPWDYAIPMVLPDGTYTGPDAVAETFDGVFGGNYANASDPICANHIGVDQTNLTYWANLGYVPQDCQGIAYNITIGMLPVANQNPDLAQGKIQYDLCDAIFGELALMMSNGQQNNVLSFAPWVNPATLNTNIVLTAAGSEVASYQLGGNGIY